MPPDHPKRLRSPADSVDFSGHNDTTSSLNATMQPPSRVVPGDSSDEDAPPSLGHVSLLCLTQNIGTIECNREEHVSAANKALTVRWLDSVAAFVAEEERRSGAGLDLVVVHVQEVGGKKYNRAFVSYLSQVIAGCVPSAAWCSGLLMAEDDDQTFTAMGACVFVSARILAATAVLNFRQRTYVPLIDNPAAGGSAARRQLFHGLKFSNAGTSRKGFLLTSLRVGTRVLNFVNTHLFHDADNTVAAAEWPNQYTAKRSGALAELLGAVTSAVQKEDALLLFGDFNFRLDTHRVKLFLEKRTGGTVQLDAKKVHAAAAVWEYLQTGENWAELRHFDTEGKAALDAVEATSGVALAELPRRFAPTYLIEADAARRAELLADLSPAAGGTANLPDPDGHHPGSSAPPAPPAPVGGDAVVFQRERWPAWCDRVLFNPTAGAALVESSEQSAYWTAPLHPMDHVAVYFRTAAPASLFGL